MSPPTRRFLGRLANKGLATLAGAAALVGFFAAGLAVGLGAIVCNDRSTYAIIKQEVWLGRKCVDARPATVTFEKVVKL